MDRAVIRHPLTGDFWILDKRTGRVKEVVMSDRSDRSDRKGTLAIGARLGARNTARQILAILDDLTEEEYARSGWTLDEVTMLERLAEMKIEGFP